MRAVTTAVLLLLTGSTVLAQSAEALQRELETHAATVKSWTEDKTIVEAVRAQNAKKVPLSAIQHDDTLWMAGKNEALVKHVTTGPCADRLRELATKAGFGESFVMDDQGALVCATGRTSDYWQGDEAKWIRSFDGGKGATFIDRPRYDDSSHMYLAQISVPIIEHGKAIGVVLGGAIVKTASH